MECDRQLHKRLDRNIRGIGYAKRMLELACDSDINGFNGITRDLILAAERTLECTVDGLRKMKATSKP